MLSKKKKKSDRSTRNALQNSSKEIYQIFKDVNKALSPPTYSFTYYFLMEFQSQNYQDDFGLENSTKQSILRDILTKNKNLDKVYLN